MAEVYRDIHNTQDSVDSYLRMIADSDMSPKQKERILRFVEVLRLGKSGKKVENRRIAIYLQFLVKLHKYFKKDLDSLTEKESEKFYKDLMEDKIRRNNGMPYKSKGEFIKALKRYLGWCWERESKKYVKSLKWMREDKEKSTKKAITLAQAEDILRVEIKKDNIKELSIRNQCLFMFLFDSGARIEEALNVRIKDLIKSEKKDSSYFLVHLRGTKTEEADRTIAIPLVAKYLNQWLKKHPTGEQEDFLFPMNYDNARKIIKGMSKDVIGFELKPHELRHSSATYYIQYGGFGAENIGGFYYRYGWKFGSEEALTYIKTHLYGGELGQSKVVNFIVSDKMEKLEEKNSSLEKSLEAMRTDLEMLKKGFPNTQIMLELMKENKGLSFGVDKEGQLMMVEEKRTSRDKK